MEALQTLRKIARNPAEEARKWRSGGKKVMGYRCLYVPEEIIWAADMLPFPLYGTPEPVTLADAYFQPSNCEFVRNLFDLALKGELSFVDYLALPNTCDVMRKLHSMWEKYVDHAPVYLLNNPQKLATEDNRDYYVTELERFREWVEKVSDNEVTSEKLKSAIRLHNETRSLLKEIYGLRKDETPPITADEALDVSMAATVLPKERANPLLRQLIDELNGRELPENEGPRILVTGSIIDHPALIKMVDEEGGHVVADDLCNTMRYFWHTVDEDSEPIEALYRYFNRRPLCACMHPLKDRLDYLTDLAREFDVEAVINFNLKYCHSFLYDSPMVVKAFAKHDIPAAVLEVGHDLSGHGQLRTRIQAFIEMVEG